MKTFSGGVHPQTYKEFTVDKKITTGSLPKRVCIPLLQNTGDSAKTKVRISDNVLKGQIIGDSESFISSRVHASISGKVIAIEEAINPIYGMTECIFIEGDGKDSLNSKAKRSIEDLSGEDIINIIKDSGIVGLGGAAFPTHVKLMTAVKDKVDTLIINGAECEPYLTCDHRLMIEKTKEIIEGIKLLAKAISAKDIYIAIEDNKLGAIFTMEKALGKSKIKVITLKTKYPQGGEKQLIKAILNREVPPGKLPPQVGCIVQSVATAYAVYEAVYRCKPLIERCITLTGTPLKEPGNFIVRIGTLLSDLVESSGGFVKEPAKIILGGPMMGVAHYTLDMPIIKGITGVVFLSKEEIECVQESSCIRCGKCVDICPVNLIPTDIAKAMKKENIEHLKTLNVSDCIECGACSFSCPARLPLLQYIKLSKNLLAKKA